MIRRIHIQRYKSLRDVEVALKPLSVLFGPNAAGKSNFIDALQLLSRIAASRSLKEAFEPPYRGKPMESFSFDETGLEGLMKKESVSFQIEADIELSPTVIAAVNKEIARNGGRDTYDAGAAHIRMENAPRGGRRNRLSPGEPLFEAVACLLRKRWSPEQIANRSSKPWRVCCGSGGPRSRSRVGGSAWKAASKHHPGCRCRMRRSTRRSTPCRAGS